MASASGSRQNVGAVGNEIVDGVVKQLYLGSKVTPQELLAKLKANKNARNPAEWWKAFDPVIEFDQKAGVSLCFLKCIHCQVLLTASNPSSRARSHINKDGGCNKSDAFRLAATPEDADVVDITGDASKKRKTSTTMQQYMPSGSAVAAAVDSMALFFYSSTIPLHLIEHPDLVTSLKALGVSLPSRKQLSTTMLDKAHAAVKREDDDIPGIIRYQTYEVLKEETANPLLRWAYLPYSMHMAGPREAIQHMIIRKNYGCTHFIIGRDMAGCKSTLSGQDFYGAYDAQETAGANAKELGMQTVPSLNIAYTQEKGYVTADVAKAENLTMLNLSGTKFRQMLRAGDDIPEWFAFKSVVAVLRKAADSDN